MSHRDRPDQCPGALKLHLADDGAIGRLRFPGGLLSPANFTMLADLADSFGDGDLHLTSRGNVQIRGIRDTVGFTESVDLPYPEHDRMRNILKSPLTGRVGGRTDVTSLTDDVDEALCSQPQLADLPGRTLFAIDDGRGDVLSEAPDLGLLAVDHDTFDLIVAGRTTGVTASRANAPELLTDAALTWSRIRGTAWRIAESGLAEEVVGGWERREAASAEGDARRIGWIEQTDGLVSLGAGLRFGVLPAQMARIVAVTEVPVHVTPWYSLVFHDFDEAVAEQVVRVLAPNGFEFDERSPWLRVTACTGMPGCAKALSDVRAGAAQGIASGMLPDARIHFSGCSRRCGAPKSAHVEYVATGDGEYDVSP